MPAEARRMQIIDILSQAGNGVIGVSELAQRLGVSEMTIRRDLDWLEQRAILTRVHGGAMALQKELLQRSEEKPFDDRLNESNAQKRAIGWAAAQLVKDGDRIILDAGTTMQQLARNLGSKMGLTVITNNIPASTELARYPQIETILLGGILKHQEMCTVGPMVKQGVAVLSVDRYFMSASGFTARNGVTDPDMREVEVKQAMMQAAGKIILVADSSKFGLVKLVKICPIQALSAIVTDDAISPAAAAELETEGVEVFTPERIAQMSSATSGSAAGREASGR